MRPKIYQGYVVLLLVTALGKFQILVKIFAHYATPSCGHGVNSTFPLGLPNGFKFCYR